MALSFTDSRPTGAAATVHTFTACDIGEATATRRVIVGVGSFGSNFQPTVTIGGIAADNVVFETRPTNWQGLFIAVVPTGETADIVVTHPIGVFCQIGVWRATKMTTNTYYDRHDSVMSSPGTTWHRLDSIPDGICVASQTRTSGDNRFYFEDGALTPTAGAFSAAEFSHGDFSGASHVSTHADLIVAVVVLNNINSGWCAATWADGGEPDDEEEATQELELAAEINPSIQITLSQADEEDPEEPHVEQPPNPCPIPGRGSEVCIVGRTTVPPGYGQILCGQAEYVDPCD